VQNTLSAKETLMGAETVPRAWCLFLCYWRFF